MPIADQEYTLYDEPLVFVFDGIQPPRCGYSYTFSATGSLASDGTILFKSVGREFDIYSENESLLQGADKKTFFITVIAEGYYREMTNFMLTIKSPPVVVPACEMELIDNPGTTLVGMPELISYTLYDLD